MTLQAILPVSGGGKGSYGVKGGPVTEVKLDFGTWEQIFYGEFDGGRRKRVLLKIIGE